MLRNAPQIPLYLNRTCLLENPTYFLAWQRYTQSRIYLYNMDHDRYTLLLIRRTLVIFYCSNLFSVVWCVVAATLLVAGRCAPMPFVAGEVNLYILFANELPTVICPLFLLVVFSCYGIYEFVYCTFFVVINLPMWVWLISYFTKINQFRSYWFNNIRIRR